MTAAFSRQGRPRRRSKLGVCAIAGAVTLSLVAGVASYVPEANADPIRKPPPAAQKSKPVPGKDLAAKPVADRSAATSKNHVVAPPVWPTASTTTVSTADLLPGKEKKLGTSPITLTSVAGPTVAAGKQSPVSFQLSVLDRAETSKLGIAGLVTRIRPAEIQSVPGRVRMKLDYSGFRNAYGGDWASRLQVTELACSTATTCNTMKVLPGGVNDAVNGIYSVDVSVPAAHSAAGQQVAAPQATFALMADGSGPNGSYEATSLSPSSTWNVGTQTGDFNWSYPLRVPPGTAGPRPELSLSYNSGQVDGQTASTNNQVSWVGQGFSLETGYVERKYVSCADDMEGTNNNTVKTADLCWKSDNATLSLGSHSSELLWDATKKTWKLRNDDGSKIERIGAPEDLGAYTGEYWVLTTADGTKYYFGSNKVGFGEARTNSVSTVPVFGNHPGEPCYKTTFATSFCTQAWRWSLDYVIKPNGKQVAGQDFEDGDVMTYRYVQEDNYYGRNNNSGVSEYQRGSYLTTIEYGERAANSGAAAPAAWVVFNTAERCVASAAICGGPLNASTASNWPDVPFDQICTSSTSCPSRTSPSFFSRKRLSSVVTQVWTGTAMDTVDRWDLSHSFPRAGDGTTTAAALWLNSITHRGEVGGTTATDPPVKFARIQLPNRVDGFSGGAFPMYKDRLAGVDTESGQAITVNYAATSCPAAADRNPANNGSRCFPVYYTIDGGAAPTLHWFHKYVVQSVVEADNATDAPDRTTSYSYEGPGAWHFDDNELTLKKYRTWGSWRGFSYVYTRVGVAGAQSLSRRLYFRGMDGDYLDKEGTTRKSVTVKDSRGEGEIDDTDRLNGFVREEITYNGVGGDEVSGTISSPWLKATGTGDGKTALLLGTQAIRTRTRLSNGTYRTAGTNTTLDDLGMPTSINDLGDVAAGNDDRCTRLTYTRNESRWIMNTVSRKELVSLSCASEPTRPAQVISDELSYYDGHTGLTTAPTVGLVTRVDTMSGWDNGPVYKQRSRTTYDALGRVASTYDGLDRLSGRVEYTPVDRGPVTEKRSFDAAGNKSTTIISPAWGASLAEIDPNGKRTDLAYDPLGRLTGVWMPDRSKAGGATASVQFAYKLSHREPTDPAEPNVVTTRELLPNGTYKTSKTLFDAALRPRQVQTLAANGVGRIVADTTYDARGNVLTTAGPYWDNTKAPSDLVYSVLPGNIPALTTNVYDGADRVTNSIFSVHGSERWRTIKAYGGNAVWTRPPSGATTTAEIFDIRGNLTHLRQHHGASTSTTYDTTTYSYTPRDELNTVRDQVGNTWTYKYDIRGRLITSTDPDKGESNSTYDDADRLTSVRDDRNQSLHFSYDSLDRKTAVRSGSSAGTVLATWAYDSLGKGLLTSSTRIVNGNSYVSAVTGYDALNRPTGTRITIPASEGKLAGSYSTTTQYNPDGSIKESKLPTTPGLPDETLKLSYNAAGNLRTLGGWTGYVNDVERSPYGEANQLFLGSDLGKSVFQYRNYEEGTRRISSMRVAREGVGSTDDTFNYTYDQAGNVFAIAHVQHGVAIDRQCFDTDHLRRTTEAWTPSGGTCTTAPSASALGGPHPYWHSYTYDQTGNRTKLVDHARVDTNPETGDRTDTYTYPAAGAARPHALAQVSSVGPKGTSVEKYTYDAVGNVATRLLNGNTDTFNWDSEGHLASVTRPGSETSFVYNAEGERLIRRDPKGSTLYLPSGEVRWDKATDTASSTRYYSFDGQTVAMRTGVSAMDVIITDHHNTAALSIDSKTGAVSRRWNAPFGGARAKSTTWDPKTRGFVNGIDDESTGLTHLGAREYDSRLGRFISVDPLVDTSDPQTLNAYAYSNNAPVTFTDPDGLAYKHGEGGGGGQSSQNNPTPIVVPPPPQKSTPTGNTNTNTTNPSASDDINRAITQYTKEKHEAKERVKRVVKDLVKIVADELGITDALNCFTNGDVGACASTGVTILTSFAGGIAGKLLAKYGAPWKWKKATALIGRIKGLADEAISGLKGWRKAENDLRRTACNSFVPGTLVLLANGTQKPIEEVQIGDKVVATDPATGKKSTEEVTATIVGDGLKKQVELRIHPIANGKAGSTSTIVATKGHPFYLPALKRWVDAGDITPGTRVQALNSTQILVVASARPFESPAKVHNLTVRDVHTYYVLAGQTPVLVHNSNCDLPEGYTSSPALKGDPYHPDSVAARSAKNHELYAATLKDRAAALGYRTRIPPQKAPFDSHGQDVFSNGKRYISPDADEHNVSGGWKMFNRRGARIGTYDADLNYRKN
ncbi:polymorphic toxin-type HINT domain-containing protein [Kribbella deserti]|uniref:Polymorphic toxin-type HINT domain-containing protein n=1 Tax=Kribbella deserti TaxID=1926257 RepID=A0ABV6QID4_9ACTN